MTHHIPVPQPPLTPEQIAVGKDVEIRRLTARVEQLEQRLKIFACEKCFCNMMISCAENDPLAIPCGSAGKQEWCKCGYCDIEQQFSALTQAHQQAVKERDDAHQVQSGMSLDIQALSQQLDEALHIKEKLIGELTHASGWQERYQQAVDENAVLRAERDERNRHLNMIADLLEGTYIPHIAFEHHPHAHNLRSLLSTHRLQLQQAVDEKREWIDKWDAHDHYPHGYVHAQIGLRERTEVQFQAETLRTSMLAQLLLEFAKIYSVDHFQEAWPKACHRCDLLKETKQALELPVNTAWEDHLKLKAQLQQAVEALKAWEHWYDQDASEFNRDTARAMGVKFLATHKEKG